MKKGNGNVKTLNGLSIDEQTKEQAIYLFGRTEERIRSSAEAIGIPWNVLAATVAGLLHVQAGGPLLGALDSVPESGLSREATTRVKRLSKVAVAERPSRSTRRLDGRTVRAIKRWRRRGATIKATAQHFGVAKATVERHQ